jgi:hypothetical protein
MASTLKKKVADEWDFWNIRGMGKRVESGV